MNKGPLGLPRPFGGGPLVKASKVPSEQELRRRLQDKWDDLIDAGVVSDIRIQDTGNAVIADWDTPNTRIGSSLVVPKAGDRQPHFEVRLPSVDEAHGEELSDELNAVVADLAHDEPQTCGSLRAKSAPNPHKPLFRPHFNGGCRSVTHTIQYAGMVMREAHARNMFTESRFE